MQTRLQSRILVLPAALALAFALALASSCGGAGATESTRTTPPPSTANARTMQDEANALLAFYDPIYVGLYTEMARASWKASTDVREENTGLRTGADTVFSAFAGNAELITRARALLEHRDELDDLTVRQLRMLLHHAANAPQTNPDLARRKVAAESAQSARLDGFQFCLERRGDTCRRPVSTNDIDRVLAESSDLRERLRAWEASKEVGVALKDGLVELRDLRNGVAREMGYSDFFAFQVDDYGMTSDEMMELNDRLIEETRPLFTQLHCWAKRELAGRYHVRDVPRRMPAHWVGNRWAQSWPGLVEGVDMDALVEGKEPEWIVRQAERFYASMGFPELPATFWSNSDLYPVAPGETREKNDHASAWHIDLNMDVRSLMSVEADWRWFGTTHHELGHIYYFLSYARPEVPPLLREGANRAYHEGMGNLIELASGQTPYLVEIGLLEEANAPNEIQMLMDSALTGSIVFLPFAAGTMARFEKELYADELPADRFQSRWWELAGRYQGIEAPGARPDDGCDACTKTHINDDPAQYYDYALAEVLVYQLHDHICRNLLHQDPRACNYYQRHEAGDFLQRIMRLGATRDWRTVLREETGSDLTAAPMLEYYRPLMEHLARENEGHDCAFE